MADLLTNNIIAELPFTDVQFTQQLNSIGNFSGSILLSGVNQTATNIMNGTIPAKTAIYVDRDGVLLWGGIVWSRTWSSKDQRLSINAREFESYLERRVITTTTAFTSQDPISIAKTLITNMQAATNGNIGIVLGSETSTSTVTKTYYSYELKTVYNAIRDLSKANNGFDFSIYVYYDINATPTKLLRFGSPRSGVAYSPTNTSIPVIELPGNLTEYEYPEDGVIAANKIYAVGAGSNEGKIIVSATDATKITDGWPLLEDQINYSDQTDTTLLGNFASAQVGAVSYPPTVIKTVMPTYIDPIIGSYQIGDDIRVRIKDDRFPNGLDTYYRLVAYNVTVGENRPEVVTMSLTISTY